MLIGRVLGKEGLGIYAAALAWVFPLSLIADFGISTLMTREIAREASLESSILAIAIQSRLVLGGGLTLLLMIAAPLLATTPDVSQGLRISAPLILITPLFGNYTAIFRAHQEMWPIPWLNLGMLLAQVALTIMVFALGGSILSALVMNTVTSAAQLIAAYWIWKRWFKSPAQTHIHALLQIRTILTQAWPFAIAGILTAVQTRLAPILLEKLTDTANVGAYAAASRFVEAGRTIPNALFGALLPLLATLIAQPHQINRTFRKVMLGLTTFSGLLALIFTFSASLILRLTYGTTFLGATNTLQIAMWGLVPSLLRAGITLYWYAYGHERLVNRAIVMILIVQFLASWLLIPAYGAYGAAVGVLVSESFGLLFLFIPLRRMKHYAQT